MDKNKDTSKLVKSTDLPLTGNPYPPKDVIQDETPSSLEKAITSARTSMQPVLSPICGAYNKTKDVLATGVAHSQSTFQTMSENQNTLTKGLTVAGSTLFGLLLARRKGFFKKALYMTTFFTAASAICFQDEAKKNLDIAWVMAKNNLPTLASDQYQKLSNQFSSKKAEGEQTTAPKEVK